MVAGKTWWQETVNKEDQPYSDAMKELHDLFIASMNIPQTVKRTQSMIPTYKNTRMMHAHNRIN